MAIQIEASARITVRLLAISVRLQCWVRSQPVPEACDRLLAQSTTLMRHESMPLFLSSRCTLPLFVADRRRAIRLLSYSLHAPIVAPIRALIWCLLGNIAVSQDTAVLFTTESRSTNSDDPQIFSHLRSLSTPLEWHPSSYRSSQRYSIGKHHQPWNNLNMHDGRSAVSSRRASFLVRFSPVSDGALEYPILEAED